jgi:hypothetical protein
MARMTLIAEFEERHAPVKCARWLRSVAALAQRRSKNIKPRQGRSVYSTGAKTHKAPSGATWQVRSTD